MKVIDVSYGNGNVRSLSAELARLQRTPDTGLAMLIAKEGSATMLSPTMHNAAYAAMGEDIVYIRAGTDDLDGLVAQMRDLGDRFKGASVTIPYKLDIMRHLDFVDETARRIGAVNTVVNVSGRFYGYNSDYNGAEKALTERMDIEPGMSAVVIGAGGAGRGISYMLKRDGFVEVTVYNRSPERAKNMAEDLDLTYGGGFEKLYNVHPADIIINATSIGSKVGSNAGESPVPEEVLPRFRLAFDAVFLPQNTLFLSQAVAAGLKTVTGDRMLLHQAVMQVELFTRGIARVAVMEKALGEYLQAVA